MGIVRGRYRYTGELLALQASTGTPQILTPGPSPIRLQVLTPYLLSHPDQHFAHYILAGLQSGFRVGFVRHSVMLRSLGRNHPSSSANHTVVDSHISQELAAGRYICPSAPHSFQNFQLSPIGLVPKNHLANQWRVIVDLSSPMNRSVNDGIPSSLCSVVYFSIDEAIAGVLTQGVGTHLIKIDLKNAYRVVPVHPDDQPLLGISWKGSIYFDRTLPFGLRSAPKIFTAVADAVSWVLYKRGVGTFIHYLDDFLIFATQDLARAGTLRDLALDTFRELNIPVSMAKLEGPATSESLLTQWHCSYDYLRITSYD